MKVNRLLAVQGVPAEGAIHFPNDALSEQVPAARGLGSVRYRTRGHVRFGMTNGDWRVRSLQLSKPYISISQSVYLGHRLLDEYSAGDCSSHIPVARAVQVWFGTGDASWAVSGRARRRLPADTLGPAGSEIGSQNAHIHVKEVSQLANHLTTEPLLAGQHFGQR